MTTHAITLDMTPPSMNASMYKHWRVRHREKQKLQAWIESALLSELGRRQWGRVEVTAELRFPTLHRRDMDNYRGPLSKSLGDALVRAGYIVDDTPIFFYFGDLIFHPERGRPTTWLTLEVDDITRHGGSECG